MPQKKSKKIFIYLIMFLLIGTLNNKNLNNINFTSVNKIKVLGLDDKSNLELIDNLNFLKISNLFFLNKSKINEIINSNNIVDSYLVFKEYPSSITVKIDKTKFLAQIKKNDNNFLLGSNGKLIKTTKIKNDIPFIFGDFENKSFFALKNAIDQTDLDYNTIKSLFFFKSGRWDVETKNGILIKLPKNEVKRSLEVLIKFLKMTQKKKISEIDLRQNNQIVING